MTELETQIWNTVHNWCDAQTNEIPDQNRRYLMDEMKALVLSHVSKSFFFCRHKWVDFKIRNFDEPKMDSKGRLTTKMLIRECSKCGKMECFAMN